MASPYEDPNSAEYKAYWQAEALRPIPPIKKKAAVVSDTIKENTNEVLNVNPNKGTKKEISAEVPKLVNYDPNSLSKPGAYDEANNINNLMEMRKQQAKAALQQKYDTVMSGLGAEEQKVPGVYSAQRSNTTAQSMLGARNFAEFMANRGLTNSGANAQAELARNMSLQRNIGALRAGEAEALADIARRKQEAQANYASGIAASDAEIGADTAKALLDSRRQQYQNELNQYYQDRNFGLQMANQQNDVAKYLNELKYGRDITQDETAYSRSRNALADTRYDEEKGYNRGQQAFDNQLKVNADYRQGNADYRQGQALESSLETEKLQRIGLALDQKIKQYGLDKTMPLETQRAEQLLSIGRADLAAKEYENSIAPEKFKLEMEKIRNDIAATNKQIDISQQNANTSSGNFKLNQDEFQAKKDAGYFEKSQVDEELKRATLADKKLNDTITKLNKLYVSEDDMGVMNVTGDKNALALAIVNSDLDEKGQNFAFAYYGLPLPKQPEQPGGLNWGKKTETFIGGKSFKPFGSK
jgi:hypothetical protein